MTELALRVVVAEGLEALTMPRLARDMDVAVGGLYRYFKSKEDLLAALQRMVILQFRADLEKALFRMRGALESLRVAGLVRVLLVGWQYWKLPERAPAHFRLIAMMVQDPRDLLPDDIAAPNVRWMAFLVALVLEQFDGASRSGLLSSGPSSRRALLLWGSLHGLLQLRKLRRFEPDLFHAEDEFNDLMRALLRSWGGQEADVEEALDVLKWLAPELAADAAAEDPLAVDSGLQDQTEGD